MQHTHMDSKTAFGKAVRRRRDLAGWKQRQLSEASGIGQEDISKIERGKQGVSVDTINALAAALSMRPSTLIAEAEAFEHGDSDSSEATAYQLTRALGIRVVPLISWVEAGRWSEAVDAYARGTGENMIKTEAKVGRLAYALRVNGDSMTNPRGENPTFPSGTVVIVDPHRELLSGSLIISRSVDAENTTFKRYVEDGARKLLVPLNPQYPVLPVDREMVYCGTVVAKAEMSI